MCEGVSILSSLQSENPDEIREGAYLAGKEKIKEAVPLLVGHLQSTDIGVQEAAERALRKIGGPAVVHGIIPLLRSDDAPVRNISMDLLREVGVTDMEALYALLHDNDPDIRIFASDILGSTGSVLAVEPLCQALLKDPEVNVRYQAAVSLGNLAFPEAAGSLNKALEDDEWVRFSVIEALIKIRDESSVGALVKALDHSSDLVASIIVDALGEMGNIKAVPLLARRLDAAAGPLRNKIVTAVIKILGSQSLSLLGAKEQEKLYEYMLSAINDEEIEVQDAIVRGLAALKGERATEAILRLALSLNPDTDHERLLMMVDALAAIGYNQEVEKAIRSHNELALQIGVEVLSRMPAREGIDVLKSVFWDVSRDMQRAIIPFLATQCSPDDQDFFLDVLEKESDGSVIKSALLFLGRRGDAREVGEKVAVFLDHSYPDVREAALDASIALHDPVITAHFLSLAESEDPEKRLMGVFALGSIDVNAYEHIIRKALHDPEPDVRKTAVEALGRGCPLSSDRLQCIKELEDDPSSDVRLTIITIISECNNSEAGPVLLKGLKDSDPWVRVRCIENIGKRGMSEAVPRLVELLADPNELIVIKAVEALGVLGGEEAFRSLFSLMDHENYDIQRAAEEAIEKIRLGEGS